MTRRHGAIGCSILVSICLAGAVHAATLQVAIDATFDHPSQLGTYRTQISSAGPIEFAEDRAGGMTAVFPIQPGTCFGISSWAASANPAKAVGPATLCLANDGISEDEFNDWTERGKKSGVDPRFAVTLGPPRPTEPPQPGQRPSQTRTNLERAVARMFLNGCGADSFHRYADLAFEKGTLAFTFWTDAQGASQASLQAGPVMLASPDTATWDLIRNGCDEAQALPAKPLDGQGASFAGTSVGEPPDPTTLAGQFGAVGGEVNRLVFQQRLDGHLADNLLRDLYRAMTDLQETRPEKAEHEMQRFADSLGNLERTGQIDPADAKSLAAGALSIDTFLVTRPSAGLPPADPALYCPGTAGACPDTLSTCAFTQLYVDAGSRDRSPDGTAEHPFATLADALDEAAARKACGLTLHLAPARYAGPIEITRHTRVLGQRAGGSSVTPIIEGTVINRGPYLLELQLVTLSWYRDELSDGLFVDHPCAITRLDTAAIRGYRGFGIRQRGGSLRAQSTIVADTRAQPASLAQGAGVLLTCGAAADLIDVVIDSNESAGLLVAGPGTRVDAFVMTVEGTRVHPAYADAATTSAPWGAVHVRDSARLGAVSFDIARNLFAGVFVDTGAEAVLDHGRIADTQGVAALYPAQEHGVAASHGALVAHGAQLQMTNFVSTRAGLCGVYVVDGGQMDLSGTPGHNSIVSHNAIGACVTVPHYNVRRLTPYVRYEDNGINLQAATLALPESDIPPLEP